MKKYLVFNLFIMQKVVSKEVWCSDKELFCTTYLTFDKIRQYCENRKSYDAWKMMNIYLFYARCSSVQEMKKVYATNKFVSEWTWYSEDTITKYTKAMQEIWCIERILKYNEQWKFIWHFIKISFCIKSDDNLTVPDMDWNLVWKETPPNTNDIKELNTNDTKIKKTEIKEVPKKIIEEDDIVYTFSDQEKKIIELYESEFEKQTDKFYSHKLKLLSEQLMNIWMFEYWPSVATIIWKDDNWFPIYKSESKKIPNLTLAIEKSIAIISQKDKYKVKDFWSTLNNRVKPKIQR